MKLSLGEIADRFDLSLNGDPSVEISNLASIDQATDGDLVFLFSSSHRKHLCDTKASAVVMREIDCEGCRIPYLISERPRLTWANIATLFDPLPVQSSNQHPTAVVSDQAIIGTGVSIGPHCVISADAVIGDRSTIGAGSFVGQGSKIGDDCRIFPNVSLYHMVCLGNRVIIHSGAVIGADGFGFEPNKGTFVKIPQIRGVVIGDHVEIGAGTTIDRGALSDTIIGSGVKIDNQVQIGHATRIGEDTIISGCTAIAGSTTIGRNCWIGGAVGIIDNIEIADQVEVTAMSLVTQSVKVGGQYSSGTGLMRSHDWKRNIVGFKQLSKLLKRVRKLESERGD